MSDLSQFNSNKNKIYIIILLIISVIIVSFLWLNYFSNRFTTHNKHMTYALTHIKYLVTKSNLSLKEHFYEEDNKCDLSHAYLEDSLNMINTLMYGGIIRGFEYNAVYNNDKMIVYVKEIKQSIIKLKSIQQNIIHNSNINKNEIKNKYRENYIKLIKQLDTLDNLLVKRFKMMYKKYTMIKYSIYVSLALLILVSLYMIRNLNKEIEHSTMLSYIDTLTNVQNVKGYKKELTRLFYMYKRYETLFTVILLDVDDFKKINDNYGHSMGDLVLVDLAKLISQNIRKNSDMLFRIGGEEFIVLCQNVNLVEGVNLAEKLRSKIMTNLTNLKNKQITVSLGVTQIQKEDNEKTLFDRADEFLYFSKKNGKNRVTSSLK